jgi:hypothetical protein
LSSGTGDNGLGCFSWCVFLPEFGVFEGVLEGFLPKAEVSFGECCNEWVGKVGVFGCELESGEFNCVEGYPPVAV